MGRGQCFQCGCCQPHVAEVITEVTTGPSVVAGTPGRLQPSSSGLSNCCGTVLFHCGGLRAAAGINRCGCVSHRSND